MTKSPALKSEVSAKPVRVGLPLVETPAPSTAVRDGQSREACGHRNEVAHRKIGRIQAHQERRAVDGSAGLGIGGKGSALGTFPAVNTARSRKGIVILDITLFPGSGCRDGAASPQAQALCIHGTIPVLIPPRVGEDDPTIIPVVGHGDAGILIRRGTAHVDVVAADADLIGPVAHVGSPAQDQKDVLAVLWIREGDELPATNRLAPHVVLAAAVDDVGRRIDIVLVIAVVGDRMPMPGR